MKRPVETKKVVLIGEAEVGKSTIISQVSDRFFGHRPTFGLDFVTKVVNFDTNQAVTLQIWDTVGQERFRSQNVGCINYSTAIVIVFSDKELKREFFAKLAKKWITKARDAADSDTQIYMVFNDKQTGLSAADRVTDAEVHTVLDEHRIAREHYFKLSAKNHEQVQTLFRIIAKKSLSCDESDRAANISEEGKSAEPQSPRPVSVRYLMSLYQHPRFRSWLTQVILTAIVLSTALIITAFTLNATLLPLAVAGMIKALSATAAKTVLGATGVTGVVAAVGLAASLHARFFYKPNEEEAGPSSRSFSTLMNRLT